MLAALASDVPAQTVLSDPVQPLLDLLVALGVCAALSLVLVGVRVLWWRERLIRTVAQSDPDGAAQVRRATGPIALLRAKRGIVPADPYARTHRVVVAPLGDGRPGESFWGPGENVGASGLGLDGSRQDARVVLAERTSMLVVCLGRVGQRVGADDLLPAAERVHQTRQGYVAPQASIGPVDRVDSALGVGWRTTCTFGGSATLTDTHVDHDGWAFVVGVLSHSWHARAVEALDGVLTTWRWIDDAQPAG